MKRDEVLEPERASGETFRDSIGIIDRKGKRIWVYPRKPQGAYHRLRIVVSILLLAVLFGLPFIRVGGHPFLMLNVVERKFIIFGMAFWPQDFYLFALAFLAIIVFIFLFTSVFGRIWCGWACPQTIFMEMVFRKIEYAIEGDGPSQYALNHGEWTSEKFLKKFFKHTIFFAISFIIGNTLLAYVIGTDALFHIMASPVHEHIGGFTSMIFFSLIFYWVFSRFREQACVFVCPYGRLQSVLLDKNSIVVMYDFLRGEPRGKISRLQPTTSLGDCIDCKKCVQVCPTGIDIRNGTQMECVNCTACMDACDEVMEKINRPKKLIRYASHNLVSQKIPFRVTPRIIAYSSILTVLVVLTLTLIGFRKDIQTTILRAKGPMFQQMDNGDIRNIYTAKILNKTFDAMEVSFKPENFSGTIRLVGTDRLPLPPDELVESTFLVDIPQSDIPGNSLKITIGVYRGDQLVSVERTSFIAPIKQNSK